MNARKIVVIGYTIPDLDHERATAVASGAHLAPFQCSSAAEASAGASKVALGRLQALVAQDIERALRGETLRSVVRGSQA